MIRRILPKSAIRGAPGPTSFVDVWPVAEAMLVAAPELEAKIIFEYFLGAFSGALPGRPPAHVSAPSAAMAHDAWSQTKRFTSPRSAEPGEVMQTDWTRAAELRITIAGTAYPHLLCHSVLVHSNWEWATRCASESLLSLRSGIQAALSRLGRVAADLADRQLLDGHAPAQQRGKRARIYR